MIRFAILVALLLVPVAAAYEEEEAPRVRVLERGVDDVMAVWHEPEVVQPGTQWHGFIQFRPGHSILNVSFQICDVGRVCFAAPIPVDRVNETTWSFDTQAYQNIGGPIHYKAGWRLGTQFILSEQMDNGTIETYKFPKGIENPDDLEYHYFAFDMPDAPERDAPGPGFLLAIGLLAIAWRRR